MRITNGMLSSNMLSTLNNNLQRVSKYQTQLSTGKRLTKLSDDPIGVVTSMQARVKLNRIEQYKSNVQSAQEFLTQVETSVREMNAVVQDAYETAVNMASDSIMADEDKDAAAELIGQLRDHILSLGNSVYNDTYIFGGYNTKSTPFEVSPSTGKIVYNGLDLTNAADPDIAAEESQNIEYEVGAGMKMEVTFSGAELMGTGDNNLYTILDGLYQTLKSDGSADEVGAYIGKLNNAQSHLLSVVAEIGGRTDRLDLIANRYEDDTINFTEMKSNVEDVDEAEATLQYQMAQTVYTYALQVGANILNTSLLDFLK